ncbi:MAG: peptidoglycan-associated lipoprotein [Proteobacteria bacterium]|nr:MAG: peptidoglycan-associated lipoprotein [Pseudomonadota bacterium]PIE64231.1 MAG: peptidoglycan-associated lipoprotein [Desulfobacterales bacterium]
MIKTYLPGILLCFVLVLTGGCGKKSEVKPEGNLIGSMHNEAVQKQDNGDFSAGELESLTQTGVTPQMEDTESDAYKMTYGRSTAPLLPVFFEFDSSAITDDQLKNLNESGRYLITNSQHMVRIEGNCDERGTTDYNLALGELRAISVKKYLINIGVDEQRLSTISFGSQKPLYPGNDEHSWAMNRRADLVIQ